jgi:hypothetical protein
MAWHNLRDGAVASRNGEGSVLPTTREAVVVERGTQCQSNLSMMSAVSPLDDSMPILRVTANGDAHWSRDYIEHLRAVHFVLIVSAVTSIALSRAPSTPQLQVAQHQIRTIIEFVNKQIAESPQAGECPECERAQADAAEVARARAAEGLSAEPVPKPPGPSQSPGFYGSVEMRNRSDWLVFTYRGINYFAPEPDMYTVIQECSIPDNQIDNTERESAEEWRMNLVSIKTLDDFINMWDSFRCGKVTEFNPEDASATLVVENTPVPIPLRQQEATEQELIKKRYVYLSFAPSDDTVSDEEISNANKLRFVGLHTTKIRGPSLVLDSLEARAGILTFTLLV